MAYDKDKPIVKWPGYTALNDGNRPVINAGPAVAGGLAGFIFVTSLIFILTWWHTPVLPAPMLDDESIRSPLFYNLEGMWATLLGLAVKFLQFSFFHHYHAQVERWMDAGYGTAVFARWYLSLACGVLGGWYALAATWVPVRSETQVGGRPLLKGAEAYSNLKREFAYQMKGDVPGLVMMSDIGLNPNDPKTFISNKPSEKIVLPDSQRRSHKVIFGGSGRGKTQVILADVIQILHHIKKGEKYKLLLVDTPKSDYARFIRPKYRHTIAPDQKVGEVHAIALDLILTQDAQQFWAGKIPSNDKDSTWVNASRAVGSGMTVFFAKLAGKSWGYANLAWAMTLQPERLEPMLANVYPEALQILRSADATISSVMFNLSAFSQDIFQLARVWEGYDYKQEILQYNAAMLKLPKAAAFWLDTLFPVALDDGTEIPFNVTIQNLLKNAISGLMQSNPSWKWVDLAKVLSVPFNEQCEQATRTLGRAVANEPSDIPYFAKAIAPILKWAKVWDEFEAKPKFSVREWTLNENPDKKILCLSPSGRFKDMTDGLVRGLLYFMTGLIDDNFFPDDKTPKCDFRRFYIICDEFQSRGNLQDFIQPITERGRSKGVTLILACQDLAQLKTVYSQEFVDYICSNTGNLLVLGANAGSTAEAVSNLVGKKLISKLHTSHSYQADGQSRSVNFQEHEGVNLQPSEVNSLLGVNKVKGTIRYLYLPGLLEAAYILETPLVKDYRLVYEPVEPDWMSGVDKPDSGVTEDDILKRLKRKSGGSRQVADVAPVRDAADELEDELADQFEPDMEMEEAMAAAERLKQETKPLYRLPPEEEDTEGGVLHGIALDALGAHGLCALKDLSEIADGSKNKVTSSKKKFIEEWDKCKSSKAKELTNKD